ncbi:hypothetical protein [Rhizobium sp. SG741]|uniref:hypothetical protein n=1 Tax=Rhizobium sp. SG741 TaxID=2587114 RepID=UPI0014476BE0|nr:hypothetical protein [Rhizobium sp. SG741]NKJ03112.1 hypothetical protein [Rhizobium sp. SG741]
MTDFDPTAIAGKDHNLPPHEAIFQQIDDLYDEAKNWADGEPITDEAMHDAITKLYDGLHELGKQADELRVEKKKPLDDQIKAIQDEFNPYIQAKRGKVDLGKSALGDLLAAWRAKVAAEKKAEADKIAAAAEAARKAADEAMRASSGNLAAREEAEEQLAEAKRLEKTARRWDKATTTGTGLRTVWVATLEDAEKALDWAFARSPGEFNALAQKMADEAVRGGARAVPGFSVTEDKRAA